MTGKRGWGRFSRAVWVVVGLCLAVGAIESEDPDTLLTPSQLKQMSLEELMDVKVTLLSKRSEDLSKAASSIQVLTYEEMRRAGITTLNEALRMFPNLQVARTDAKTWVVTARGQNDGLANKLLVMIDGRSVYTPLYAGVFWDVQSLLIENIDRIEVISGPGGSLWGANAVNGVINIVTKSSDQTHGGYMTAAEGTYMRHLLGWMYGDSLGRDWHYNVWARKMEHEGADSGAHAKGHNGWGLHQGGFRADWVPAGGDRIVLIGSLYGGDLEQPRADNVVVDGQYLLGRWTRNFSGGGQLQGQFYFDRTHRDIPKSLREDLRTWDFDFQQHLPLGARHTVTWGAGWRLMQDDISNSPALAILPERLDMHHGNFFAQDEFIAWPDRLRITLGSKVELTHYSGFEVMPSGRLAWTPDARNTVWAAVSRAVRAPSRIDVDFYIPAPATPAPQGRLIGGDFKSEYLTAYEAGWRHQLSGSLAASLSLFHNVYEDLRILEAVPVADSTLPKDFKIANGAEGEIQGAELALEWQARSWWRLRGGGTWMKREFRLQPGQIGFRGTGNQGNDPEAVYTLQSMLDLPAGFELNFRVRYVSELPAPKVPYYATTDVSVAWNWRNLRLTVTGHDLSERRHAEFGSPATRNQIPRSVSGRIGVRF